MIEWCHVYQKTEHLHSEPQHLSVSRRCLHLVLHDLESVLTVSENVPADSRRGMGWCHILGINKLTLRTHQSVTTSQPRCDKLMWAHDCVSDLTWPVFQEWASRRKVKRPSDPYLFIFFSGTFWTTVVWGYATGPIKIPYCSIPAHQTGSVAFY